MKNADQYFEDGYGFLMSEEYENALLYFKQSADKKHALSQYFLGWMYDQGLGVEKNQNEAFKWWFKSAQNGYVLAQQNIGFSYEEGCGVSKNYTNAYYWYSLAIKNSEDDETLISSKAALNRLINEMSDEEVTAAKAKLN